MFYIYVHRKATTREIFYVGKGKKRRAYEGERNNFWRKVVKKHGIVVEILEIGYQEWYAHEREVELIALYGRRDIGLGPLVNLTDGGEGVSNPGPETRNKMSEAKRIRTVKQETKDKLSKHGKDRCSNPEYITLLSSRAKKQFESAEARLRVAESSTGRKMSDKNRLLLSERMRTFILTPEARKKISDSKLGKAHTDEHKAALKEAWVERKLKYPTQEVSPETCEKLRLVWVKRKADRIARNEPPRVLIPEHRAKISAGGMGRIPSLETREKLRVASTGRTFSPETIEKMRSSALTRRAREHSTHKDSPGDEPASSPHSQSQ